MRATSSSVTAWPTLSKSAGDPDFIAVIGADPRQEDFGRIVDRVDMPNAGDELHHFGYSSDQKRLIVPGLFSNRVHVFDVKAGGRELRLRAVNEDLVEDSGYIVPHGVMAMHGKLIAPMIGAATDYSLLYVARYREALRHTRSTWQATQVALRGSVEPILASGGTVIAGLLCLLLSDLKSNSTLGPVASIGIIFAMLSALSFLPALLYTFGRASFWPRRPSYEPDSSAADVVPTDTRLISLDAAEAETVH